LPVFNEPDISWVDWTVKGFTGIELWNGFSELKVRVKNKMSAYFFAFFPCFLPFSPPAKTIQVWDNLLNKGIKTVAIGGSDAHAIPYSAGFIKREIFPYAFHFRSINNHILLIEELTGIVSKDQDAILDALRKGLLFIANDMIKPSLGFRFYISNENKRIQMGGSQSFNHNLELNVMLPYSAECIVRRNGLIYKRSLRCKRMKMNICSPGIYRVECYKRFLGKRRGWIFSNPIYIE
jgi:hypothetical protein